VTYEGQAAIELEMAASGEPGESAAPEARHRGYPLPYVEGPDAPGRLDARATLRALLADLERGEPVGRVAARFHEGIARGTAEACRREAARHGVETIVLSGGVFQNVRLLERTADLLSEAGLRPLAPAAFPPNDGGLSYGQAACAAARLRQAASQPPPAAG
jgi:hydrogenase maturation protein HypF